MKRFLAGFNRQEPLDESQPEMERDAQFSSWLEKEGQFPARPDFQTDLRARLQARLVAQATPPARHPSAGWMRLVPAAIGLAAVLIFTLALVSGLSLPDSANATPVAVAPTSDTGSDGRGEKLFSVYDEATQSYVDLQEAAKTVGFTPRLPQYLPAGYKVENAALTYDANTLSNRTGTLTPPPTSDTRASSPVGPFGGPHGFQFQLTPVKASDGSIVQVYQLRIPPGGQNGPRFNVQGATRFDPKAVQGATGYAVQGARWRVDYPGPPARSDFTPGETRGGPATSPGAANNRPPGPPPGRNFPPMSMRGPGAIRPGGPPPGVKPANARIAFGRNETSSSNSARPGFYIDFQFADPAKATHSLVWEKDGVLIVLVASDSISDAELQRIADSFKPTQ